MAKERDILGGYRLTRLIHNGNTCHVWEAVKPDGSKAAIKTLKPKYIEDKNQIALFRNESEVEKAVQHPNVIKFIEFSDGKEPFLITELFSEISLKKAIRKGTENVGYMLTKIIDKSCQGLYAIHGQGYLHCDVKPENFLVNRDGDIRVIGLALSQKVKTGIAKLFAGKPKAVAGTLSYMSPEQARGERLDVRTDVYSYGCLLFELVTGKPPYTGNNAADLLNKHISAPIPSPVVSNDNVTQEFTNVLKTLMAKKPEQRFPNIWEAFKVLKVTKIFKTPPRIPDASVFDQAVGNGDQE